MPRRHDPGKQGTVGFRLDIGADGRVTGCTVTVSSGSAILHDTTCQLMLRRLGFHPARDTEGKAVPDTITSRIDWRLPQGAPPPPPQPQQ